MTEYAQVFDRLARFAPELVPTNRSRRDKFIRGLNSMVARDVHITMSLTETTYAQAVERALTAERAEQRINQENAARREFRRVAQASAGSQRSGGYSDQKRKVSDSVSSVGDKKQKNESEQRQSNSGNWRDYPFCEKCKRHHRGECKPKTCYQCKSPDHIKRNCPQLVRDEKKPADPFVPSRVYSLTQPEASESKTVVTG